MVVSLVIASEQGQQVELHGAVPVKELRVGMVFL